MRLLRQLQALATVLAIDSSVYIARSKEQSAERDEDKPTLTTSLNKPKLDNLADEIWKSAERLRGKFKAYEYQNVILPIIVIRRLECVLIKWREEKAAEMLAKRPEADREGTRQAGQRAWN